MCHVENEPEAIAKKVDELIGVPFTASDKAERSKQFGLNYNNLNNANKILKIIQNEVTQN
jgi:UDP-N-acetylglucosamine 2-epimerase